MTLQNYDLKIALKTEPLIGHWWFVDNQSDDFKQHFNGELKREVKVGHILYGEELTIIARGWGDDCLFKYAHNDKVVSIHLTYSINEKPPYPFSFVYENLDDWYENEYIYDFYEKWDMPDDLTNFEQFAVGYAIGFVQNDDFKREINNLTAEDLKLTNEQYLSLVAVCCKDKSQILTLINEWLFKKFGRIDFNLNNIYTTYKDS